MNALEAAYGQPETGVTDPFEMVLWENIAYLVDDQRREAAFRVLRDRVGLTPEKILAASRADLLAATKLGGMHPEQRVERLREIAGIAVEEFGGDVRSVLVEQLPQAKRRLRKFPSIGDPGAEKILLFCGRRPIFALESNGLRVLLRLGYGEEKRGYAATYRSVQEAVRGKAPEDAAWMARAHQLLRRHGRETCLRARPRCEVCPVTAACAYYANLPSRRKRTN